MWRCAVPPPPSASFSSREMGKDWGDLGVGLLPKGGVRLEQRDHRLEIQKRPKHYEFHALILSCLRLWD